MTEYKEKINKVLSAYREKEWSEVVSIYSELATHNFELSHKNKTQWVVSLKKSGMHSEAEKLSFNFLEEEKSSFKYVWLFHIAECKQSSGDYSQAIEFYKNALKGHKSNKMVFYRLSQCYIKLRDYDSSLHYIKKALSNSCNILFLAQLATICYKKKNWQGCVSVFDDALKEFGINAFRPLWIFYYADSLYNLNDFMKSSGYYNILLKFGSVKSNWLFKAYLVYLKNGEIDLAEETLASAIEGDKNNAKFYLEMARLSSLKGDVGKAEFFYKKSSSLGSVIAQHELLSFDSSKRIMVSPENLLTHKRFDLVVKFCYAKELISNVPSNSNLDWCSLYIRHIYLRTRGKEPGSSQKNNLNDHKYFFSSLVSSIKENGFNPLNSVPIALDGGLVNGAHRTSSALALGLKEMPIVLSEQSHGVEWGLEWFVNHGFSSIEIHEIIYNWIKFSGCKPYIAILWPTVYENWADIITAIESQTEIIFSKTMNFNEEGLQEFVKDVYSVTQPSDFSDKISNKAEFLSQFGSQVKVLLLNNQNDKCADIKNFVRDRYYYLLPKDPLSIIHVSDSNEEVLHLNMMLFHFDTASFLQSREFPLTKNIAVWVKELKSLLKKKNISSLDVCGVGGAVLNVYGLKQADDLDVTVTSSLRSLYFSEKAQQISDNVDVVSRDYYRAIDRVVCDDLLIFDRAMYIYVRGLKFANLNVVRDRKMLSLREKDLRDLSLIGSYYNDGKIYNA